MKWYAPLSVVILAVGVTTASAQEQKGIDPAKQKEMMEKAMAMIMPGPEHELLTRLAGQWNLQLKAWSAPGKEPTVSTGTAVNETVLGERFVKSTYAGTMMGMPVEGLTMLGFDKRTKKYTSVVFDTFGTYYVTAAGEHDATTHTITMSGSEEEGAAGGKHEFDFVLKVVDDNTYIWSVIFRDPTTSSGTGEFKMIEATYTRAGQ